MANPLLPFAARSQVELGLSPVLLKDTRTFVVISPTPHPKMWSINWITLEASPDQPITEDEKKNGPRIWNALPGTNQLFSGTLVQTGPMIYDSIATAPYLSATCVMTDDYNGMTLYGIGTYDPAKAEENKKVCARNETVAGCGFAGLHRITWPIQGVY
ncbi:hypothetical protein HYH03_018228 [Edaphochlamys debaryana]|uniref:Uncharacterized protein n=1 Tax=Edaphochlamys debaryana TaxID=47281 RepID=A0A835XKU0_9CHLO|nr:hypothetical protein HYH03_018228 [Edaphochlamys debaryana]|eukprot:KAG2482885.1 hypothetical protein HYH03_018228 [Edaphochlamys debaryana]